MKRGSLVVCGGGVSGLLAAKALAEHFQHVVVLEARTATSKGSFARPVSQGHHVHHLLRQGMDRMVQLFPNLDKILVSAGAVELDYSKDISTYGGQGLLPYREFDFNVWSQSRELVDNALLKELRRVDNVRMLDRTKVCEMTFDRGRVNTVIAKRGSSLLRFDADVVLDCTGAEHGRGWWNMPSAESHRHGFQIAVDLHYRSFRSRSVNYPKIDACGQGLIISPQVDDSRFLIALPVEKGEHLFTIGCKGLELAALEGDPKDFVMDLCRSRGIDLLISPSAKTVRLCQHQLYWNRFQNDKTLPSNLFPIADKVCLLSPFSGQGMSLAICHVTCLRDAFHNSVSLEEIRAAYLTKIDAPTLQCWLLALARECKMNRLQSGNGVFESEVEKILELDRRAHEDPEAHFASLGLRHRLDLK